VAEFGNQPAPAPQKIAPLPVVLWINPIPLARDLHDGVGQSIGALLVQIRVALARGVAGPADLRVFEEEAQNALSSVRALAYGLRRDSAREPLEVTRRYAERILEGTPTTLAWIDNRKVGRLSAKVARHLAWSIRESITNVAHYASASLVEVRLEESGRAVRATVRDDGIGFSPETFQLTADGRGLGLLGNAERMAEIGGIFRVISSPGQGTHVVLEAPRSLRRSPDAPVGQIQLKRPPEEAQLSAATV
jgi:two-component system, NarL family, sensor histidine kinase NreB